MTCRMITYHDSPSCTDTYDHASHAEENGTSIPRQTAIRYGCQPISRTSGEFIPVPLRLFAIDASLYPGLPTESPFPLSPMLKVVRAYGKTKNVMPHCSTKSVVLPTLTKGGKGQRATTPSQASWVVQLFIPPTVVQTLLSIAQIVLI